jgi:DNA-binding NtrC family response regulator
MGRTVLLCDDDRLFTLWLSRLLKEWGWTVQTTLSVHEAVSSYEASIPDLLIVDLYIGEETAADLFRKLKLCQDSPIPIILVSAASTAEMQSVLCGTEVTMLSKPIDPARLKSLLAEISPTRNSQKEKTLSFLILDNGGIQAKVLGRMVEDAGAFVIFASTVENAKTLIRNVRPDAVLIESDGSAQDAEALSAFCIASRLSLPPMIALLSVINQTLVEKLLRAGVVDILLKPISVNRLQESIRRVDGRVARELPGRSEGRKNIMVVEDFTITAKMLERLLTQEGYQVHVVRSAEMAYEMIRRIRPDLMLLDLNLPGMSGLDLLQSLNATGQAVPTVISTGDRDPRKTQRHSQARRVETIQQAHRAGRIDLLHSRILLGHRRNDCRASRL